jgi:hypothetical protein
MENDLRFLETGRRPQVKGNFNINGRQPQFKHKWKTTSFFWLIEEALNVFLTGRPPQCINSLS